MTDSTVSKPGEPGFRQSEGDPLRRVRIGVASAPAGPTEGHGFLLGGSADPAEREAQRHPHRIAENLIRPLERER